MNFKEVEQQLLLLNNDSLISYNNLESFYDASYSFYLKNSTLLIKIENEVFSLNLNDSFNFYIEDEENISISSSNLSLHLPVSDSNVSNIYFKKLKLIELIILILEHCLIKRLIDNNI